MNKHRDPGALDPERNRNQKNRSEQRSSSPFLSGLANAWSSEMHFLVQVKIALAQLFPFHSTTAVTFVNLCVS